MASIASQLQAIKSALGAAQEPARRPITRPSVLFDPKEAADIDLRSILPIALSGLEHLATVDERFARYRNTIFSETSLEVNRELQTPEENDKLNKSISTYLRLLAGYLQLPAALKTLEYLIRRYLVHVYNLDELLLCALPYHDTHAFVRIVQLVNSGNSKWAFLDGVKSSGAPPPRSVIVQQCIRDKSVLETLCNYVTPTKEFHHSRTVVSFCTAVIVECLGTIPKLDTDIVQRVLGFVFESLNPAVMGDRDYKAGALMIVGVLATRATLALKLVQNLIFSVSKTAQHDAFESNDLPWLRVTVMAIISLVQSQSIHDFPKKPLMILKEIRDFTGVLSVLASEYNIERFMRLYVESLVDYSASDDSCLKHLIETVEILPMKNSVERIVCKVLGNCMKVSRATEKPDINSTVMWAKKLLSAIERKYTLELRDAIRNFLEKSEINSTGGDHLSDVFGLVFDESKCTPSEICDSNIWFSLDHPKAMVRQSALSKIATSGIFNNSSLNPQKSINMQDAILRSMYDDDLSVVEAALSIEGLAAVASPNSLLKAYDDVLTKCIKIITKGGSKASKSKASDIAISCLEKMVMEYQSHHMEHASDIALVVFRLLIVHPKTLRVNLKALELAKKIQWDFYTSSSLVYDEVTADKMKNVSSDSIASINMKNIRAFAETFLANPNKHVQWLANSGTDNRFSRTLFLLIVLQALVATEVLDKQASLCQACLPVLKDEWCRIQPKDNGVDDEISLDKLEKHSIELVKHIFNSDTQALNARILVCIFWGLLRVQSSYIKQNSMIGSGVNTMLDDMFLFFITSAGKNIFQKHIQYLIVNCTGGAPFQFISKYFLEEDRPDVVQVESLLVLASIYFKCASSEGSSLDESICMQLLLGFPSVIPPLAHENKDIRSSAIKCVEALLLVWQRLITSPPRNGSNIKLPKCMSSPSFGIFLESLVNQKTMLSSDAKFLPAYISSMLSPRKDMMVPENLHERFDQSTKDALLHFILCSAMKLPPYAKFMVLSVLKGVGSILFQAEDVKSLFFDLLDRRDQHQNQHDSKEILFTHEMKILCLLLEVLFSVPGLANVGFNRFEPLVKALRVDALCPDDPVVVMPCLTALRTLQLSFFDDLKTDTKEKVLGRLVSLFRSENFEIRNAARDALLRVNVDASTVIEFIEVIAALGGTKGHSKRIKRKDDLSRDAFNSFEELFGENPISSILVSLLDILFLKKDVNHRSCLLQPLFQLLSKLLSDQWISGVVCQYSRQHDSTSETPDSSSFVNAAQQLVLLVLKDITDTLQSGHQDAMFNSSNIELLIDCVRSVKDISTRNHGFLLIASLARACPRLVSESTIDLFVAIGDAIKQDDSHSQHVLEDLLSVLVPCWLSKTTSIEKLLQIFIKALADVAEHRRLTLMVYLLRTLGEESNLSTVIMHLLHSLVERISHPHSEGQGSSYVLSLSSMSQEWEYGLAVNVTDQYSYKLWFPCLSKLLKEIRVHENQGRLLKLNLAMRFILFKLQDTELVFELESNEAANFIQGYLGGLMEEVVLCTVFTRDKKGDVSGDIMKEFRDSANTILKIITGWMSATTYFRGITQLLDHSDSLVKRKTLGILSETARGNSLVQMKQKKTRKLKHGSLATTMIVDKTSGPYFNNLCLKILELIDRVVDSDTSVKIAAISSLDTLAKEYGSDNSAYSNCLATIVNHIGSGDATISSGLIHTAGSLINVLGSKALPQLPLIMKNIILRSHQVSRCPSGKYARDSTRTAAGSNQAITVLISALTTTEVIVEKLGEFVNPYLEEILDLVVLHPECVANMDAKLDAKAKDVRKLLTEKVPVRLILPPLLNMHSIAAKCGEASLSLAFDMLASLVSTMDRQAVGTYHTKIYEQCLEALDLRRQHLDSLKNINMVEQSIIHAIITLTMKLTEGTFRPLFLRTLGWVESEIDQSSSKRSLDRAIVFYKLVNKLAEQHRSLFTPYFKYLLDGSVQYLSEDDVLIGSKQKKKKKAKLEDAQVEKKEKLFGQKMWNLRALILKSLHKCFLYDNDQKILDTSNFQMLLKPIVSQFVVEPPESSESVPDTPSVNEVDETIVLCLGQMAVTARSDVLWKPLNHEVLMQTRSDKVRPKMLGLKVVRYMVQHLKEEYIVLLPETIPFLGELLEDVELPVKTLSQEILKEMETLSGESLRQYL